MRVHIYKTGKGTADVMVVASPGKGRPPILVRGVLPENVADRVGAVVAAMRKPKAEPLGPDL